MTPDLFCPIIQSLSLFFVCIFSAPANRVSFCVYCFCPIMQSVSLLCVCDFLSYHAEFVFVCASFLSHCVVCLCSVCSLFCIIKPGLSLLCVCSSLSCHTEFVFAPCVRLFCHIMQFVFALCMCLFSCHTEFVIALCVRLFCHIMQFVFVFYICIFFVLSCRVCLCVCMCVSFLVPHADFICVCAYVGM